MRILSRSPALVWVLFAHCGFDSGEHGMAMTAYSEFPQDISRPETLTERAYRQVKRAIRTGMFSPGQKITTRAIAGALDVSATPAREALTRLVSEGALEMAGPKTVVIPSLQPNRYEEIITIRLALEGIAAEKAVENANDDFIEEIELTQIAFVYARNSKNYMEALQYNEKFHFMLYALANQPKILSIIENLWALVGPSLRLLYPRFAERNDGALAHSEVIAALRANDPKGVRNAIERDIMIGRSKILPILRKEDAGRVPHEQSNHAASNQ